MRDNSLLISKYVQKILEESEEVVTMLDGNKKKIFALKQNENISFPFIVHSRSNLTTTYTNLFVMLDGLILYNLLFVVFLMIIYKQLI